MIFRRSLVREMTVTAVGLFLVLLGILFTNLVLRLLALAAGGTVAPDGLAGAARLQRPVLFQYSSFGHDLRHGPADARALVSGQRDDRLVHVRRRPRRLPASDPVVRRPVLRGDPRAVAVPVALGRTAQTRIPAAARVARRDRVADARTLPRVPPRQSGGLRREHQHVRRHHPQRLPAFGRGRQGRHHGRAVGIAAGRRQRRPVHRAGRRAPVRRQAGQHRIPHRRVRAARAPDRAGRAAGAADVDQGDPDRHAHRARRAASSARSCSGGCRCRSRRSC